MRRKCFAATTLLLVGTFVSCGPPASLQRDQGVYRVDASRQDLEAVRSRLEDAARSQAYSPELRAAARKEAEAVRARLREGDFRVGDQIVLTVERVPALSDTFTVSGGLSLRLPTVGELSLSGVLRSELAGRLTEEIGRFVNDPVVRARSYVRISITGEVRNPGFYVIAAETPLSEAIMLAGGPSNLSDLRRARVDRGNEWILRGDALQFAVGRGATLGELRLRSGDELYIPGQPPLSPARLGQTLLLASGVLIALAQVGVF